jgi:hypothetical protein
MLQSHALDDVVTSLDPRGAWGRQIGDRPDLPEVS